MDSQLASVLTSGSLNVQNGSQRAEGSGPVTEFVLDPKEKTSLSTVPGNIQPVLVKAAVTTMQDAPSINGKKPEVGGTPRPASQETSKIGGFRQPITVKTGVPVLRSQPIRLKIVVPPRCKRPITNSAISLTKEVALPRFRRRPVSFSPGAVITEKNRSKIQVSAVKKEIKEVTEEAKPQSFYEPEAERGVKMCKERDVSDAQIIHTDETPLISSTVKTLSPPPQAIKEETTEREIEENIPLVLQEIDLKPCDTFIEVGMEGEQTEPLDLSLPNKRESRESRCGGLLDDSDWESSLIMEVEEYEGDGDRDIVEEDDEGKAEGRVLCVDATNTLVDSLPPPSFFSNSVFSSIPSIDCDAENLLLIDNDGIPYTLGPNGLKVPQVDASGSQHPQSDQANLAETEVSGSSLLASLADPGLSQSLDNALEALSDDTHPSPAPSTDPPSLGVDHAKAEKEVFASLMTNTDPSKAEPSVRSVQEANVILSPSSGISLPTQHPIQILTNMSTNAPILLLSSSSSSSPQLPSAPVGLSLPLSVTQSSPGASTPMFLLLSSVPGDSASTSTPIAVLDPSTGQLSQITSAPLSLPVSHPVIRLSPNNPPVILSGGSTVITASVFTSLTVPSSSPALQSDLSRSSMTPSLLHSQTSSSDSNPTGSEAISAEEVSNENKPSTFTASPPHPQSASLTCDPSLTQPASGAQSPTLEPHFDPSDQHLQHLPLDDHLYFSNAAAPASPPIIGPVLSSGELETLDPLDALSPEGSPNDMASRRVLYCQLCPRVFFYLSDLERHAITHSQKKPHVCQQCGKAFKRSSHLQRHNHIHTGQRNFVCPICAKRFREAGELQRHQRVHTGEKPYQCQLCHTRFAERNTLRRHTRRKHPYHQVAMEMLNERRGGGQGDGGAGGGPGVQEEEESAEWYSSTVSNLDNSESDMDT